MVDTRLNLATDVVLPPTRQCTVVPLRRRGVPELTGTSVSVDVLLWRHFEALTAVVELPDEAHVPGVRLNLALDFEHFVDGGAHYRWLVQLAHRSDCQQQTRK